MTGRPRIWVHASDAALAAAAQVLAQALTDEAGDIDVRVTTPRTQPGMATDPAQVHEHLADPSIKAVVVLGDALPMALIEGAAARGLGLFLADTENPEPQGFRRLVPGYARKLLGHFTEVFVRSPRALASLSSRGPVARARAVGALAMMPPAPACNEAELQSLRTASGTRSMWLAVHLPRAEAECLIEAHVSALRRAHDLLLIAQPADTDATAALAQAARAVKLRVTDMAQGDYLDDGTQVCLLDPEEDPGLYTRLSPLCYLGSTLTRTQTERPVSLPAAALAASLGSALIMGPFLPEQQRDFLQSLVAEDAALQIADPGVLSDALTEALQPERGAALALRAWTLTTDGADATAQVARAVIGWLDQNGGA